ncbi:hypothetical protein MRB53_033854 [Persea americana]|uniref:Uncharacterized protein n=1 Tax=Persea americana TaxID=3435 RepID=A0ACC2KVU4_PERAE|nr:hypothetical protein MRB53_033854 [Persea americana]
MDRAHLKSKPLHFDTSIISSKEGLILARLDGTKVALKKPVLFTSDDLDKFHRELQQLWLATFVPAHARPTNYMFFFQF